jgi:hypothetical protein
MKKRKEAGMSNVRHVCFDRILPRDLRRAIPFRTVESGRRTRAISPRGKVWPNGSTLKIAFMGGNASQHDTVKRFAPQWTEHANLGFEFIDVPDADIRIAFEDDGAWSYIGTDAKGIPFFQPTMNYGWLDEGVVLHEFGHAIGLAHEHSNPEGGIDWNDEAVIRELSGPPNFWDEATVRHNVLHKYTHDQIHGTDFDSKSIMLYSFPAEWTTDGFHTEPNEILSEIDKAFIAGREMYPRERNPEVELPVGEIALTEASIGEPGEEDMFRFAAASTGRYTVETEGETDLVLKLYGPNNRTMLIAEDDDGGRGYNPRITVDLIPGQYFIQIRHYNRTAGTGPYGIKVFK